ncbi:putative ABC transporter permease protein YurN [Halomicronema hongdechloris C2206]|uniref:ABC transporter permease protein YurN n=1 Tax=Halomicronema hongdechloris C2206 TaxID=1641165 RepID=A0A1Z3HS31_9CYAN|nr:sugar ABC transporter permease [Halomicronema hongdechloris]ASC73105.1 putative ABC transporter permease protein YurN [Halomicronema hongdechloris C2206]
MKSTVVSPPSRQRSSRRWLAGTVPYLFLLPALAILGLTVFWPALQAFYLSFTSYGYDLSQPPVWIGWDNFQRLLQDPVFWQTVRNTLLYLVGVVPILAILPLVLAILVNRSLRGMRWFRVAYYLPVVISMVVAGIAWRWLYAENGLLNQLLMGTGLRETGIPWLTSPSLALLSVMAVTVWKGLGYYMVIYLAGLQTIPLELYEAAAMDGSDGCRRHWDITLPLMWPYIVLVTVISAIAATKVFEEVFIMTQGGPRNSSKTIVYYVYEQAFQDLDMNYACAIGLVLFLVILALSMVRLAVADRRSPLGG